MMAKFQNTIDLLGDEVVAASIIDRTITEFRDDVLTSIGSKAFYACSALTSVDLSNVTSIPNGAFGTCSKLNVIILRSQKVCTLSSIYAFLDTPFAAGKAGGTVYVPQALITEYQNATNWSTLYAAGTCNFVAIEGSEYE
jgi:hypothetical protein